MPEKVQRIIDAFRATHPTATDIRVSCVTRKAVFLKFHTPVLGPAGVYVGRFEKKQKGGEAIMAHPDESRAARR